MAKRATARAAAGAPPRSAARFRVLLADDSEAIRVLLRALISLEPEIELAGEAPDGETAVALAESTEADALVLDVAMPGLDGLEVLERLRSTRPDLRIVVYSGFADPAIARAARRLGADDVIVKGAPPQQLVASIVRVCRGEATT